MSAAGRATSWILQEALDDPTFQRDFGIGPGCESTNGRAVPPVRLRELAEYCMEHGFNLELRFVRREDVPAPRDTALTAKCELSRDRKTDCPELP